MVSRLYSCLSVFLQSARSHLLPHIPSLSTVISQGKTRKKRHIVKYVTLIDHFIGVHSSSPQQIFLPALSCLVRLVSHCGGGCVDGLVSPILPILVEMIRWEPKKVGTDTEFKMTSTKKKKKTLPSLFSLSLSLSLSLMHTLSPSREHRLSLSSSLPSLSHFSVSLAYYFANSPFRRAAVNLEDEANFLSDADWKNRVTSQCEILKALHVIMTSIGILNTFLFLFFKI